MVRSGEKILLRYLHEFCRRIASDTSDGNFVTICIFAMTLFVISSHGKISSIFYQLTDIHGFKWTILGIDWLFEQNQLH